MNNQCIFNSLLNWSISLQAGEADHAHSSHPRRWGTPEHQHSSGGRNPNPAGKGNHTPLTTCLPCHSRQTLASTTALNWKVILNLPQYLPIRDSSGPWAPSAQPGPPSASLLCNQHQLLCCQSPAGPRARLHQGPGPGERRPSRAPVLLQPLQGDVGLPV